MDWITGIQNAIDYIENHLTETIDYDIVAVQSFSSTYHFQRIFSILCGFTVGEVYTKSADCHLQEANWLPQISK